MSGMLTCFHIIQEWPYDLQTVPHTPSELIQYSYRCASHSIHHPDRSCEICNYVNLILWERHRANNQNAIVLRQEIEIKKLKREVDELTERNERLECNYDHFESFDEGFRAGVKCISEENDNNKIPVLNNTTYQPNNHGHGEQNIAACPQCGNSYSRLDWIENCPHCGHMINGGNR